MYEGEPWEFQLLAAVAQRTLEIKLEREKLDETREGRNKLIRFRLEFKERIMTHVRALGMSEHEGLRQMSRDMTAHRLNDPKRYADFCQAWQEVMGLERKGS